MVAKKLLEEETVSGKDFEDMYKKYMGIEVLCENEEENKETSKISQDENEVVENVETSNEKIEN